MAKSINFNREISVDLGNVADNGKKYSEMTVGEFFEQVKSLKNEMTSETLKAQLENVEKKLAKCKITRQKEAAKILTFYANTFANEQKLVERGITQYIMADDINAYIVGIKTNRNVALTYLENYERDIPDEIVDRIAECQDIFDKFAILYTDYTEKTTKVAKAKQDKIVKERDPILFGIFGVWDTKGDGSEECVLASPRMYVIGDWVDENCDLTLSKMITEYGDKKLAKSIAVNIDPDTISSDAKELAESMGTIDEE